MELYFFLSVQINVIVSISFFRCSNKMCFLQIQGVQVCGIKKGYHSNNRLFTNKGLYSNESQCLFICPLRTNTPRGFLWTCIGSFPVISPQMVNMMSEGKIRFLPSQLKVFSELSPLDQCVAFGKDMTMALKTK